MLVSLFVLMINKQDMKFEYSWL